MQKIILISCFILVVSYPCFSQQGSRCRVEFSHPDSLSLPADIHNIPEKVDSNSVKDIMNNLYAKGFVEARFTMLSRDSTCVVHVDPGLRYRWVNLAQGNLPDELLNKVNMRTGLFHDRVFNFQALVATYGSILGWSELNGYPFARIGLKRLSVQNGGISASLDYEPGPLIVFDTLMISGTERINKKFLAAYLRIKPGDLYNSLRVRAIQQRIMQLKGFSLASPPEEYFAGGKCYLRLTFTEKPANGFDGYIGLLPNENQAGKVLVTGQVQLALNNLFKSGKTFGLNWQRPNLLSQELAIEYHHPCIVNSPVNGSFTANLFKQDTSFLNTGLNFGFDVSTSGVGNIGIEAGLLTSRVLGRDINNIDSLFRLADTNTSLYGINYTFRSIDDPDFPLSGWLAEIHIDVGNKKILRIPEYANTLDDYPNHQIQIRGNLSISRYSPVNRRSTVLTRISGGAVSDNHLFYNDLFRIGGLSSLRGFNEKYFYSSSYIIGNFEYRLRIEEKSFLLVFADAGWIRNDLSNEMINDWPVGVGGGFSLGTPLGNLAVIFALGRDNNQDFNFKYSRIHIGYISRF